MHIGDYLSFFSKILTDKDKVKENVCSICSKAVDYELKPSSVVIKDSIAHITCHPALKSEIMMKKEEIVKEIRLATKNHVTDIR